MRIGADRLCNCRLKLSAFSAETQHKRGLRASAKPPSIIHDRDGRLLAARLQTSALVRRPSLAAHASSSWLANKSSPCVAQVYRPMRCSRVRGDEAFSAAMGRVATACSRDARFVRR